MARVRLFAGLREAAAASEVRLEADTVGELLEAACIRYGDGFRAGLGQARVWVNGEPAELDHPLGADDEVALIPPVSGGATAVSSAAELQVGVLLAAAAALVIANLAGSAWLAAAVVGVAALWIVDLGRESALTGFELPLAPGLVTVFAGAVGGHVLGAPALGLVVALAAAATLVTGIAWPRARRLDRLAAGFVTAVVAGLAAAALVYVRGGSEQGRALIGAFLVMTIGSLVVSWGVARFSAIPFLDPYTAGTLAVLVLAVVSALLWDISVTAFVLTGVAVAAGLIAGRGLGSMVRTGAVVLSERAPGSLTALDGPVVAASLFLTVIRLVL